MKILIMLVTFLTLLFFLFFLKFPRKQLSLFMFVKPLAHPFIFLQYSFLGIPYSIIWSVFLPIIFVINIIRRDWNFLCPLSFPLLMLVFMSMISMMYTIDIQASLEGIVKLMTTFFTYSIAYNVVKSPSDVRNMAKIMALAAIVPLLFGFYQVVVSNYGQIYESNVERVNSVFGVGNGYGIFLSIIMCATLIVILTSEKEKERLFFLFLFAGMIVSQILSLNRGTWIAFAVGSIFGVVLYSKRLNMKLVIIIFVMVGIFASGVVYKRFTEVRLRYDGQVADTFQGRIETWKSLVPLIMERPLWGYGANSAEGIFVNGNSLAPHNDYVRLSLDFGLIGGITHFLFLFSVLIFFFKRNRLDDKCWMYNFPLLILSIYMIIISGAQNVVYNLTNYMYFIALSGSVVKINMFCKNVK